MSAAHERSEAGGPLLQVNDLSVDFAVDGFWVPAAKKLNYEVQGVFQEKVDGRIVFHTYVVRE